MPIYEFEGRRPVIPADTFVHPQAVIIGDVEIGSNCFIGPGAVLRGDFGKIIVGGGSNIQDNCVIHCDPGAIAILEENVLVGHGAILHGPCLIRQGALVGMGAIVSTGCEIGTESVVAAGCMLPPRYNVASRKLVMGSPANIIRDISEETLASGRLGVQFYRGMAFRCLAGLKLIE